MDSYQKEIETIKQILKENPKGMTVTDVSRKIKINRNSVAKYLDIMRISGYVEMVTFGPAKVFFPSRRIPLSSMLNFTSDYILVIDKQLRVVLVNDSLLAFMKASREAIIGQILDNTFLRILDGDGDLFSSIRDAFEGKQFTKDFSFQMDGDEFYFRINIIPTTFEDGKHGITLVIRDRTQHGMAEKALRESEEKFGKLLEKMNGK